MKNPHLSISIYLCHCTNFLVQSRLMHVQFQLIFNGLGRLAHITACAKARGTDRPYPPVTCSLSSPVSHPSVRNFLRYMSSLSLTVTELPIHLRLFQDSREAKASVFFPSYNKTRKAVGASCHAVQYWIITMFNQQKSNPQTIFTSRTSTTRILKFHSLQLPYITRSDLSLSGYEIHPLFSPLQEPSSYICRATSFGDFSLPVSDAVLCFKEAVEPAMNTEGLARYFF